MLVVDLFCGCGGFSTGAVMAGHKIVLAIDNWQPALDVHKHNHPDAKHINMELGGNIKDIVTLFKQHIPVNARWHLHGSPPCQNLSIANRANADSKEGMRLVKWYLKLVKHCKPTSWSMEQVIGAQQYLHEYNTMILNTADYGVPQTRRRLYLGDGWTKPEHLPIITLLDVFPYLKREGDWIKGYKNTVSVRRNGEHAGNRRIVGLEGFKSLKEPTYTLCAAGPLKLYKGKLSPKFVRNLTVDECLEIQGFPDWYDMSIVSSSMAYKLIGNAVCPKIAYLIMIQLP